MCLKRYDSRALNPLPLQRNPKQTPMKLRSLFLLLLTWTIQIQAQTLEECQQAAERNYPLIRQYGLIRQTADFTIANIQKGWLPQFSASAQATYQTDVTAWPTEMRTLMQQMGIDLKGLKKDQYRVGIDVQQTLFDGGAISSQKEIVRRQAEVLEAETEANIYNVRARVNEMYFALLLLDEQIKLNRDLQELLLGNERQLQAMFRHGTAAQSDYDNVRAERLNAAQQLANLQAQRETVARMLSVFCGLKEVKPQMPSTPIRLIPPLGPEGRSTLREPFPFQGGERLTPQPPPFQGGGAGYALACTQASEVTVPLLEREGDARRAGGESEESEESEESARSTGSAASAHPALRAIDAKLRLADAQEKALDAALMPRLGVFAQGFYGYPGYNLFEDMMHHRWSFNAMAGARLTWNIGALYTRKQDKAKIGAQRSMYQVQRDVFLFNNNLEQMQQSESIERFRRLMANDEEIIALRAAVRKAAESKLKHGIIDVNALVREINAENAARVQQSVHEIEMLKEIYELKYTTNQ